MRHFASVVKSIGLSASDVRPIIIARGEDESGWIITGGVPMSTGIGTWAMRSETSCRAVQTLIVGLNVRLIEDSPGTERDFRLSRNATVASSYSAGTVRNCSTSPLDSPTESVCTCTCGGSISGRVSTGALIKK